MLRCRVPRAYRPRKIMCLMLRHSAIKLAMSLNLIIFTKNLTV